MVQDGLFRALVENSSDIIIVTDTDFKIRYVSSSVGRLFQVDPVKLVGQNIFSYFPDKRKAYHARLKEIENTIVRDEISLKLPDAKISYFEIEASQFATFGVVGGFVFKLHDISDRKNKEQELEKSNRQLDQVIYKTTHDLKSPIMSALGLVDIAKKAPDGEKDQYLDLIRKSLLKLDSFIDDMNHFFRNEKLAVQRELIAIQHLLDDELEDVKNLDGRPEVDIRTEVHASCDLFSDTIRLRTIISNLLSNAIKYRDNNKSRPFINISVVIDDRFCELRFIDNGIGIEEQYIDKIFDLFFRGTTQSQGTGLGLFIVKDTVEKLKGTIEVKSVAGEGTTFSIKVPNQILQSIVID